MPEPVRIRPEAVSDAAAIERVTRLAFEHQTQGERTEHLIVAALRRAGELALSLVAEDAVGVVGHVAVSAVRIGTGAAGWYGLGPLSVLPRCQGRGVGSRLVAEALGKLRERGAAGCVVLGRPAFYGRFGFRAEASLVLPGVPAAYFQAISFDGPLPCGEVSYHESFTTRP